MTAIKNICTQVITRREDFKKEVINKIYNDFKLTEEEFKQMGFELIYAMLPGGDEVISVYDDGKEIIAYEIRMSIEEENNRCIVRFTAIPQLKRKGDLE